MLSLCLRLEATFEGCIPRDTPRYFTWRGESVSTLWDSSPSRKSGTGVKVQSTRTFCTGWEVENFVQNLCRVEDIIGFLVEDLCGTFSSTPRISRPLLRPVRSMSTEVSVETIYRFSICPLQSLSCFGVRRDPT